jgi:hypothetical protein
VPDNRDDQEKEAEQRRHHCREQVYWFATVVLTALAAGGAVYSAFAAFGALKASQSAVIEAKRAADEAHRQADYANQGLEITRQQFIEDNRPYIWLAALEVPQLFHNSNGRLQIVWNWHFTNYGKTPANHVRTQTFMKVGEGAFRPSFGSPNPPNPGAPITTNFPQFQTVVSDPDIISEETFKVFFSRDDGIAISGVITYDDLARPAFRGGNHKTYFCIGKLAAGPIKYMEPSENCRNEIE